MLLVAVAAAGVVLVLAAAPWWARYGGLDLPPAPPAGRMVPIQGGHEVNVFDEGDGRAVVLVHGLPGSAHDWRPLPQALVDAGFRVIRYDRVGYGRSTRRMAGEPHSIEANATELVALIAALRLDKPIVVGWSYGGIVAQAAAARPPHGIAGVVLVGSDGPASGASEWFRSLFMRTLPLREWGIRSGFPARFGVRQFGRQVFAGDVPVWWPTHALTVISPDGVALTWAKEVHEFAPASVDANRVAIPVTIMHGSMDGVVRPHVAEALQRQIHGATLVDISGAGHMLPNTHAPHIVSEIVRMAESASARR